VAPGVVQLTVRLVAAPGRVDDIVRTLLQVVMLPAQQLPGCHFAQVYQRMTGGTMDKGAVGLNWWATRRWKVGFDYGGTDLDRFGIHGWTNSFHTRLQWIY